MVIKISGWYKLEEKKNTSFGWSVCYIVLAQVVESNEIQDYLKLYVISLHCGFHSCFLRMDLNVKSIHHTGPYTTPSETVISNGFGNLFHKFFSLHKCYRRCRSIDLDPKSVVYGKFTSDGKSGKKVIFKQSREMFECVRMLMGINLSWKYAWNFLNAYTHTQTHTRRSPLKSIKTHIFLLCVCHSLLCLCAPSHIYIEYVMRTPSNHRRNFMSTD